MPSSTSNSEFLDAESISRIAADGSRWVIGKWSVRLLIMCVGWLSLLELVTGFGFQRVSKTQHRVNTEYFAAVASSMRDSDGKAEVLIVGNSLLKTGVDFPQLTAIVPGDWHVKRLVVESTSYVDWYYGLRRLFQDGARPDVVCVMLSWQQLVASEIRGEYFAHYMLLTRDLFKVVHDLRLDPTSAASLVVGHLSAFYGARVDIRKFILGNLLPDFPQLTAMITPTRKPLAENNLRELAATRLGALKTVGAEYGIPVVFILSPPGDSGDVSQVEHGGQNAGVPVVVGWSAGDFRPSDFTDGFHLNDKGARRYTFLLGHELRHALSPLMKPQIAMAKPDGLDNLGVDNSRN